MQRAMSVYNGNGSGSGKKEALPHPDQTFTVTNNGVKTEYSIPDDEWTMYQNIYKREYELYMNEISDAEWDSMTAEEQYDKLKAAARNANKVMKNAYIGSHPGN